jgi:hypothetical protein
LDRGGVQPIVALDLVEHPTVARASADVAAGSATAPTRTALSTMITDPECDNRIAQSTYVALLALSASMKTRSNVPSPSLDRAGNRSSARPTRTSTTPDKPAASTDDRAT